jgi:hypothetical protein
MRGDPHGAKDGLKYVYVEAPDQFLEAITSDLALANERGRGGPHRTSTHLS